MLDLNTLRYHQDHPRRSIFLGYNRQQCARLCSIPYHRFVNILDGNIQPTGDEEEQIQVLADTIEIMEAIEHLV